MIATYADDTAFFTTNINIRFALAHLQRQLDHIADWTTAWRINIHAEKTKCTVFGRRKFHIPLPLYYKHAPLTFHPDATYLGVTIDHRMTFQPNLTALAKNTTKSIAILYPLLRSPALQYATNSHIYTHMIRSVMAYTAKYQLQHLQVTQNRALRALTGHDRGTRTAQLHEDAELPIDEFFRTVNTSFWHRLQQPTPTLLSAPQKPVARITHAHVYDNSSPTSQKLPSTHTRLASTLALPHTHNSCVLEHSHTHQSDKYSRPLTSIIHFLTS